MRFKFPWIYYLFFPSRVDFSELASRRRLDELTRRAVEDGLYDVPSGAYKDALTVARRSSR